jgi:hypothetical protein
MSNRETDTERRVTVSIEQYRAKPQEYSRQALEKEVEVIVDEDTRILVARKLAPLE